MLGLAPAIAPPAAATASPTRSIAVSGTDVAMYPAFAAATARYGLTTTSDTGGTVTVTASTSDPAGSVWIDGRPAAGGIATLSGLSSGDEISVFIKDSAGTGVYALLYLPAGFPTMTVVTKQPGIAAGDVFLTMTDFADAPGHPGFETAVDENGVPAFVRSDTGIVPLDFKRQPNGDYSVYRAVSGSSTGQVVELNSRFQQVAAYQTVGDLINTDDHDSILLPNGDRYLLADQHNAATGETDDYIQEADPAGHVLFQWDTADHIDPADSVMPSSNPDYAHLNSISLMQNGDILASFRHLDQVMEIARTAHDGFNAGDIVWRLGGRHSDFTFPNDPLGGPCAQHAASQLANGDILLYDDGSESIGGSPVLCVDPSDRTGPTIGRPQARATEYSLNQTAKQATLVWSGQVSGRQTSFAGSAQRLSNGDTLVGWAADNSPALTTEFDAAGDVVWELSEPDLLISYRALKFAAPDAIPPTVHITSPAYGATYPFGQRVSSAFSCTDQGGSSLQSCGGTAVFGGPVDTSTVGTHRYPVVATDGAGNTTTATRTYRVTAGSARFQPDGQIKPSSAARFVGRNVYGTSHAQHIAQRIARRGGSVHAQVRFQNDGSVADRTAVRGTAGSGRFRVRYFAAGRAVTRAVVAGTYLTPSLAPGRFFRLRVEVIRTRAARPHDVITVRLTGRSVDDPGRRDAVATIVHARR
jgi:hypothetical protein